jgi:hypothetical protein
MMIVDMQQCLIVCTSWSNQRIEPSASLQPQVPFKRNTSSSFLLLGDVFHPTMEVAASGIAVVSLAIQLLASTNTIKTFIRNVKDAPQELRRIAGLLDNLSALFQDVADLLEQQTSLQAQGFPLPSDAILACLQSCEDSLAPLHKIVEKYQKLQGQTGFRRLHVDIRTALKTGDFLEFGTRIQQEISSLSAAIITNNTRIQ